MEYVNVTPDLSVPKPFADQWHAFEATKVPSITITATPSETTELKNSKFGGYPYLPADFDYPKDSAGNYMFPLAQINFSEMPPLAGYPETGLLQIYIANDGDYGLDLDHPQRQTNFRVLFFEESEITSNMQGFSFLESTMRNNDSPISCTHSVVFTPSVDYAGVEDIRYISKSEGIIERILLQNKKDTEELEDFVIDHFLASGHKIGGYASFSQTDLREYNKELKDYILLLQIDSTDDIMWGDVGVANFFIHPDDLKQKDFSKVAYNWDCG